MKRFLAVVFALSAMFMSCHAAAESPFRLSIETFYERSDDRNIYSAPYNNVIKVRGAGYARPFMVILKNVSDRTQQLMVDEATQGFGLITFEITDENGNNNVVTKKISATLSRSEGYRNLGPGKKKEFEVFLNEREWNNAFKLLRSGAVKLLARAAYKNRSETIYSDYYTLVLDQ